MLHDLQFAVRERHLEAYQPVCAVLLQCAGRRDFMAITATRNLGMLLLAIWLILSGISGLAAVGLPGPLMAVLALLAGILILAGR